MRPFASGPVWTIASRIAVAVPQIPVPRPRAQPTTTSFCCQCLRPLSTTPAVLSGHNKWSKIKHKKGAADAQKNNMRSQHSKTIALYSRLHGTENNPQLVTAVANAKKDGVPKAVIDSAIARGQGRSASGASLEPLTLEAILPPGVALIIEVETESKARSLQDLKVLVKKHKGAANATTFFFTRLGRVVFAAKEGPSPVTVDDIMDDAIECGAEDLEADEEGNLVVWTQPNMTNAVVNGVGPKFELELLSSEIIWNANEDTKVKIDEGLEATTLSELLAALQEFPEVQAVYGNPTRGDIPEEQWSGIEENLDS
ncbi:transcriptional regulator-domain-containing protein [Colletotrichum phormii]|uniref:Transcriptional regulator-domain-containing protein n=1 Tax=Colletotrichum phormii TaxID=359342 RepID=A0AAJ0A091_9PEZI|nr:transcriptional regulator-domain-containing protein [Colletotrichum phormii]KAK1640173.1 transcriptional regulator-domain-containing protein [Colletotrichum phormii]